LRDEDWKLLLGRIENGRCAPFLGAGACSGTLPDAAAIATRWAKEHAFPLDEYQDDLARVAQFLGVHHEDAMFPKDQICRELEDLGPPDFASEGEPHRVLAGLPLPVYLTTNYDNFMLTALAGLGKQPVRDFCRWNRSPALAVAPAIEPTFTPSPKQPVVFHMHGHFALPESLVLTEDDYLDFLVAVSRDENLLPHQMKRTLAGSSLLFVGYSLADWDFRVIHRGLVMGGEQSLRRLSITVQLRRDEPARDYLDRYFSAMKVRVYWGTAVEFMAELEERWAAYGRGG
jgi:hypothetical protein